jgi:DNA-binding TFAR19-related protein (PDSD5 family)
MSATHTAGPWVIGHSYTDEHAIRVGSDEDLCVAVVCALDPQSDEAQANAALVATAPELLAAVDNVIEWIETAGKIARERIDDENLAAVLRSVAARARGDRGDCAGRA